MNLLKFFFLSLILTIEPIQSQTKVELFDLIKMFVPTSQNKNVDWMTGAEDNTPINWETNGIDDVESPKNLEPNGKKDFDSDLGAYYREGNVIVTIDKKPLYYLTKKKESLPWEIKLYGPRMGISAIVIRNNLISPDNIFNPSLVKEYFKKQGCEIILVKCDKQNELIGGTRLYKLTMKNRIIAYLFLDFSLGSAGYDGSLILLLREPNNTFCLKRNLGNNNCK
jgi:hypothetical protein